MRGQNLYDIVVSGNPLRDTLRDLQYYSPTLFLSPIKVDSSQDYPSQDGHVDASEISQAGGSKFQEKP